MKLSKKYWPYLLIIGIIMIVLVVFLSYKERQFNNGHKLSVIHGVVQKIEPFGKGAYRYTIGDGSSEKAIVFGGKKDIKVGDSISKEKEEFYFIFRKNDAGKYEMKEQYLRW
jgi:hypothetical protein